MIAQPPCSLGAWFLCCRGVVVVSTIPISAGGSCFTSGHWIFSNLLSHLRCFFGPVVPCSSLLDLLWACVPAPGLYLYSVLVCPTPMLMSVNPGDMNVYLCPFSELVILLLTWYHVS
jgi:hypothetical protein